MKDEGNNRSVADKQELVAQVGRNIRQMGAQSVMTSQAVAGRFGLHTTDLECLDLIYLSGQASAGELAEVAGLTSGATTALIDRLERAGYVERVADPRDRRRVHVRVRPHAIAPIKAVYEPMQQRMFELWSRYDCDELALIADFLSRSTELAKACAEDIRRDTSPSPPKRRAPRSGGRGPEKV
ncbi:MarR family transcriptional regulator [Ensifer adhaerens]|uniref:MarR family winged helix-turn-helix transcriptional regulator n=1 Tax=Ensifer adhaerens TaxID=106592 RepID=UPI001CBD98B5|nr:MarR family transcriptional regulator [Ensifer adhaerens]MBZ7924661.1 MarR family transcriptional regulator [Ensifer adhaerens]UAX96108.1 MarR family transcriptional regulator [Ensifer adhaerens]UAY04550.1 MarR family transcriptional regulator [Ensifer adhaerens]UAY09982.1 MarR family transcriptional regulator [Ensifer adhaerens]